MTKHPAKIGIRQAHEPGALILASASPARAALLKAAGLRFERIPSGVVEHAWDPKHTPFEQHLKSLAGQKAESVAARFPDAFVIGADTAILFQNKMVGKGETPDGVKAILTMLSGKTHSITTCVCVIPPLKRGHAREKHEGAETAFVTMRKLSENEIDFYINTRNVLGCAGGYELQGAGSVIIHRIEGDPGAVIGMPVELTKKLLLKGSYEYDRKRA